MGKKPAEFGISKRKTIKEKQKMTLQSAIMEGVGLSLVGAYYAMLHTTYSYLTPRASFSEIITGALSKVASPGYLFPFVPGALRNAGYVIICCVLFVFMQYTINKLRVHDDINEIKGTAKWADIPTMVQKFAEFEGKDYKHAYNNVILSENFQMSIKQSKHFHALNTLILGATGSGKSRYELKPNLLQMNSSYVITDPSGGILQSCGETLRRFGYNIRVFDLVKMGECDTYNPMKYCRKEADIKKLVQAFIKNTDPNGGQGGGSKDPFWDDSMSAFLCACIALLVEFCNKDRIPTGWKTEEWGEYDREKIICNVDGVPYDFVPNFATLCELTRMANRAEKGASSAAMKNNTANASELNTIFQNIRERYEDELEKPYCLREWDNFKIAPEKTSTTILMTTAVRLDPFNIEQVRTLTSSDTINLYEFGDKRDVLFVITPTNDRTYNFLVSFLYTQLFDILYTKGETESTGSVDYLLPNEELVRHFSREQVNDADFVSSTIDDIKHAKIEKVVVNGHKTGKKKVKKPVLFGLLGTKTIKQSVSYEDTYYDIKDRKGNLISRRPTKELAEQYVAGLQHMTARPGNGERVPTHVRFLLDEFPNLGEIPEFKEKLATMRKYEISCTVICQSITQLKGMYKDDYEVVDANCPQTIFLGGDENSNNEYISKKIGKATVKGWNNSVDSKKVNSSYNVEERDLIKPEELGKMPFSDMIALIYGEEPIYDKKYDYPNHKNYKYTHDYAHDIGLDDCMVFDRKALYPNTSLKNSKYRVSKTPTAVPSFEIFDDEACMSILRAETFEDAFTNYKQFNDFDDDILDDNLFGSNGIIGSSDESAY